MYLSYLFDNIFQTFFIKKCIIYTIIIIKFIIRILTIKEHKIAFLYFMNNDILDNRGFTEYFQ